MKRLILLLLLVAAITSCEKNELPRHAFAYEVELYYFKTREVPDDLNSIPKEFWEYEGTYYIIRSRLQRGIQYTYSFYGNGFYKIYKEVRTRVSLEEVDYSKVY